MSSSQLQMDASPRLVVKPKSAVKVKGRSQSLLSTFSGFLLKRIRGTETWQRMQIRKNTQANKEVYFQFASVEYQKPTSKLNSPQSLETDCFSDTSSISLSKGKSVNFIPLVKEISYMQQTWGELEEAKQQHVKVLELLGLPSASSESGSDVDLSPPHSDTVASGTSTPTASSVANISFIPLRCNSTQSVHGSNGGDYDSNFERGPQTPGVRNSLSGLDQPTSSALLWFDGVDSASPNSQADLAEEPSCARFGDSDVPTSPANSHGLRGLGTSPPFVSMESEVGELDLSQMATSSLDLCRLQEDQPSPASQQDSTATFQDARA